MWYVYAYPDILAAAHKELRNAIAKIVRKAVESDWVDAGKAERWPEKLEGSLTLKEGWPRYNVRPNDGALEVRYETTDPSAQRTRRGGLRIWSLRRANTSR